MPIIGSYSKQHKRNLRKVSAENSEIENSKTSQLLIWRSHCHGTCWQAQTKALFSSTTRARFLCCNIASKKTLEASLFHRFLMKSYSYILFLGDKLRSNFDLRGLTALFFSQSSQTLINLITFVSRLWNLSLKFKWRSGCVQEVRWLTNTFEIPLKTLGLRNSDCNVARYANLNVAVG